MVAFFATVFFFFFFFLSLFLANSFRFFSVSLFFVLPNEYLVSQNVYMYLCVSVYSYCLLTIKERQMVTISVELELKSRSFKTMVLLFFFQLFRLPFVCRFLFPPTIQWRAWLLYCGSVSLSILIKLYKNIFIWLFEIIIQLERVLINYITNI